MRRLDYTVPAEYDGRKVLHFLRGGAGCSYTLVRSLKVFPDGILLNGARTRTIDRVRAGDVVSITLHEQENESLCSNIQVEIVYEDADLLVFNKPAGMACHPAGCKQQGTLVNVFAAHCAERGLTMPCRILNRLDRDTSGAVLVAKNAYAAAALSGKVQKRYVAILPGRLTPPRGMIDAPIGQPDRADPRRRVCTEGRRALTEYRAAAFGDGYSAVCCTLHTGRTHQIRVHMAHLGHPLLGDALYGGDCGKIGRQALHCARLWFQHPVTGRALSVGAAMPQDMQKLLRDCVKSW